MILFERYMQEIFDRCEEKKVSYTFQILQEFMVNYHQMYMFCCIPYYYQVKDVLTVFNHREGIEKLAVE